MQKQLTYNYTLQSMAHSISIWRFPVEYPLKIQLLGYRFLYQYLRLCRERDKPSINQLNDRLVTLFNQQLQIPLEQLGTEIQLRNRNQTLFEIVDILTQFSPHIGQGLLDLIRDRDDIQEEQKIRVVNRVERKEEKKNIRTVYSDSQNVHNTKINQSVLSVARHIVGLYNYQIGLDNELVSDEQLLNRIGRYLNTKYGNRLKESLDFISTSVATFGINISLQDVFRAIWLWMGDQKPDLRNDLEKRLVDELREMEGYCTTGHLARLINVIQGFTDDDNLTIKIADKDRAKSVVVAFLSKCVKESGDEKLLEEMLDCTDYYLLFIKKCIIKQYYEWVKEEDLEFIQEIPKAVNDFIGKNNYFRTCPEDFMIPLETETETIGNADLSETSFNTEKEK